MVERDDRNDRKKEVSNMGMELGHRGPLISGWRWKFGKPAYFWAKNVEFVGAYIEKNKLEPVFGGHVVQGPRTKMSQERAIYIEEMDKDISGGGRAPHLHYKGETYLLNVKQWQDFSSEIITDFSKKLADTKTVPFEQFMELADTMDAIL
ncbi:hypothetical protein C5S35_13600 [Candidatus Methanophagaceae archaeon]|nr:hypothetical protein C5S35_13600 [Methanophagales archaeon]